MSVSRLGLALIQCGDTFKVDYIYKTLFPNQVTDILGFQVGMNLWGDTIRPYTIAKPACSQFPLAAWSWKDIGI